MYTPPTQASRLLIQTNITFTFVEFSLAIKETANKLRPDYYEESVYLVAMILGKGAYGMGLCYLGLVFLAGLFMKRAITIMPIVMAIQLVYLSLATVS